MWPKPGHAADIDDAAAALREHHRGHMLDAEQDAAHVDRQQLIDAGDIDLGDADHRRRHAGIVDQAVDAAEPFDGAPDHRLDIDLVRHVGADEAHPQPLLQRPAFLLPARGDDDLGPFLDKELGDFFADTARSAGDDGDFSIESAHSLPPSRFQSGEPQSLATATAAG